MTAQEAIDELQYAINLIKQDGKDWIDERDIPILETAIHALEKQIPKKPNKIQSKNSENLWNLYCPSCENWIGMWRIGMWNSRLKHVDMHNISN